MYDPEYDEWYLDYPREKSDEDELFESDFMERNNDAREALK